MRIAGAHSSFPSERVAGLSSTEPIQLRSDFTRFRDLPPNPLTSSYHFRHSNRHPQSKPNSLGHRFSGTAFGRSSFLTFVSRRRLSCGRLLLSIPLVQLCAAHNPKLHRARFRALRLRSAPVIDSASLRSFPSPIMKRLFLLARKGPIDLEGNQQPWRCTCSRSQSGILIQTQPKRRRKRRKSMNRRKGQNGAVVIQSGWYQVRWRMDIEGQKNRSTVGGWDILVVE